MLKRDKKHTRHRTTVRQWRKKHRVHGNTYKKTDTGYKWVPKKK